MRPARLLPVFALFLLTPALLTAGLEKYKEWGSSPQGCFMTRAEHERWEAIKTDAEAEQFVAQFLAGRKPEFAAEVAKRAEMADKYLTVGKAAGSKTLRGKIIILFGPPSGFNITKRMISGEHSATPDVYAGAAGADSRGGTSGQSPTDMTAVAQRSGMSGREIREYAFSYAGDKLPTPRAQVLNVAVDVDMGTGAESLADRGQTSELDELFAAAAATWLSKRSPAPP